MPSIYNTCTCKHTCGSRAGETVMCLQGCLSDVRPIAMPHSVQARSQASEVCGAPAHHHRRQAVWARLVLSVESDGICPRRARIRFASRAYSQHGDTLLNIALCQLAWVLCAAQSVMYRSVQSMCMSARAHVAVRMCDTCHRRVGLWMS